MALDLKRQFLDQLILENQQKQNLAGSGGLFVKKAFDHFLEMGLPEKKHPQYSYFPLAKLYETAFTEKSASFLTKEQILEKVLPECSQSYIVIEDGVFNQELSNVTEIQHQIKIEAIGKGHSPYMPFVHAKLIQQQKKETDPFALYCQSQLEGILFLVLEKQNLQVPVQILLVSQSTSILSAFNLFMHVAKQAKVELILTAICNQESITTSYIDIDLEDHAEMECVRAHSDSKAMMLDFMRVALKKEAKAKIMDLQKPEAPSKFHLHVQHESPESQSWFHALNLIENKKDYHLSTNFEHKVPHAQSYQHIKTVLKSKSKASFMGQIHVHKEALLTQSYQKHATLMLGEHGQIFSRPNLRIFADDVKASHGATITELDKEALFYLKTRGLDEALSKRLLLDAFCLEIIEKLSSEGLKEIMQELITEVHHDDENKLCP